MSFPAGTAIRTPGRRSVSSDWAKMATGTLTVVRHTPFLVADHPGPRGRERFRSDGFGYPLASWAAAAAGRWMSARSDRRGGAALVRCMRVSREPVHAGKSRRGQDRSRRRVTTQRAGRGLSVGRHRPGRGERAASLAKVVVDRHRYRSGASGIVTPPLMPPDGPSMPGLMSNSKISVGSHNVAQELGMSTTPLMWPCTGAVPRIE